MLDILDLSAGHVEPLTNQASGFLLSFLLLKQGEQPHLTRLLRAIVKPLPKV